MRKHLFIAAFCAACFAFGVRAQLHSGGTSTDTRPSPDTGLNKSSDDSSKPSTWDRIKNLAATGRTQHEVRASQLTSAEVKSSSGDSIGTISDIVINPNSGKVDFAIISLGGSTGSTSSSTPTSGTIGTSSQTSGTADSSASATASGTKQVAVPWTLLHPANTGSSTTAAGTGPETFTYSGDTGKLQTAPAFDPNTDMTKPGWFQNVFSYFGLNNGSATGGATSPGSSSSGRSSGSRSYPEGNPSNNP